MYDKLLTLHHGTDSISARNIIRNGIDLSKSRDKLDFGKGFYLTNNKGQAVNWAIRTARAHMDKRYAVLTFELNISLLYGKKFYGTSDEWFDNVYNHRVLGLENIDLEYDYISGPMVDGKMPDVLNDYSNGLITKEMLQQIFSRYKNSYQIALKTKKAIDSLSKPIKEVHPL